MIHDTESLILSLENSPRIVLPLIREVPEHLRKRRPAPGKWSAHEHACHLPTVHPMIVGRLDLMLRENNPRIVSYDPDQAEGEGALLRYDLEESMARYTRDRQQLVQRLRSLSPSDWERTGQHEEYNQYSVFIMFRHIAMHDLFHAYRIEELLLRKNW